MLLLRSAVDAIRKDYRDCVKPHGPLLFPQLQSSVRFTVLDSQRNHDWQNVPRLRYHTTNTIFYCHRFCTASSERISPDVRGSSTVLYTPRGEIWHEVTLDESLF
jgi:hypothetical protein